MRISRSTLTRNWLWSTVAAFAVFTVMAVLDLQLKLLSGVSTVDLQGFTDAAQFDAAFHNWGVHAWLARAGFNLGFDYLLMPLYALTFFYSGVIVREVFTPRVGPLRRLVALAALAPVVGAALDAGENALQLRMMWNGPTDALARISFAVSSAKWFAIYIGLLLLAGAVLAQIQERKKRALANQNTAA